MEIEQMTMRNLLLIPLAAGLTTISSARAQQPAAPAGTATPAGAAAPAGGAAQAGAKAAVDDRLFAAAATVSGLAEVTISRIGVERATDPDLKKFSQRMIDDHTRANRELAELASRKGIAMPATLDPKSQFCGQSLAGLSGKEFDNCYAKAQLVAHMEAVSAFEAEAERGQDPDVKAWAAKTLPHIREHLAMIKPHAMRAEKEKPSTGNEHAEK